MAKTKAVGRSICPKCGSNSIVPIAYGLPEQALFEAADRGEVVLGGCEFSPDAPNRHCKDCAHDWHVGDVTGLGW